jgi:hypothetical protein
MTSTDNSTEPTVATYVWIATDDVWGDSVTAAEHAAACDRAESYLDEHEGDALSIRVRAPRRGEAGGTYLMTSAGDLQILGYSVSEPEEIRDLIERAREHAIATWPTA